MPDVWTWGYDYPFPIEIEYEEVEIPMGPGHEVIVSRDLAHSLADGRGTVSSRGGRFIFHPRFSRKNFDGDGQFKAMLAFLQDKKDNNEDFYFYNAQENHDQSTWNGTTTTGRYLVIFKGNIPWELVYLKKTTWSLTFYEVFS